MSPEFEFVVSAENNDFLAWQAMLFHYSCVKQTGRVPIVVVHGDEDELVPGFERIREQGGRIQRARNYRSDGGLVYPPRNTAGSLQCVESEADYLVLCDPDILFLGPLSLERLPLGPSRVGFEFIWFMKFGHDGNAAMLEKAARQAGLIVSDIQQIPVTGGVPHIIPREVQQSLSREWLRCMDCFVPDEPLPGAYDLWYIASMWSMVFAVHSLGLEPFQTEFCILDRDCVRNLDGTRPLIADGHALPALLHYSYGDEVFQKRSYQSRQDALERVWQAQAPPDTVNGALCAELAAAGQFYGLMDS